MTNRSFQPHRQAVFSRQRRVSHSLHSFPAHALARSFTLRRAPSGRAESCNLLGTGVELIAPAKSYAFRLPARIRGPSETIERPSESLNTFFSAQKNSLRFSPFSSSRRARSQPPRSSEPPMRERVRRGFVDSRVCARSELDVELSNPCLTRCKHCRGVAEGFSITFA